MGKKKKKEKGKKGRASAGGHDFAANADDLGFAAVEVVAM